MVLRYLLRFLLSDRVVNKLADSYPFRRAAKWVVYFAHKAKAIKGDKISLNEGSLKNLQDTSERLIKFWRSFASAKPLNNPSFKEERRTADKFTNLSGSNAHNSATTLKEPHLEKNGTKEERLKKYVEELRKRTKE